MTKELITNIASKYGEGNQNKKAPNTEKKEGTQTDSRQTQVTLLFSLDIWKMLRMSGCNKPKLKHFEF